MSSRRTVRGRRGAAARLRFGRQRMAAGGQPPLVLHDRWAYWRLIYEGNKNFRFERYGGHIMDDFEITKHEKAVTWPSPEHLWVQYMEWETLNHKNICFTSMGRSRMRASMETPANTFRIMLDDHIKEIITPDASIIDAFATFLLQCPLREPLAFKEAALEPQSTTFRISNLPLEILDMILSYVVLAPIVQLRAFHPLTPQRVYAWPYTKAEDEILAGVPNRYRMLAAFIPTFHVSKLWRQRTVAGLVTRIRDNPSSLRFGSLTCDEVNDGGASAVLTMDHFCEDDDTQVSGGEANSPRVACERTPFAWGNVNAGVEVLRELPYQLQETVTHLYIEAVWDYRTQKLLSPVKRLIGFESLFEPLERLTVTCRVINYSSVINENADSNRSITDSLYGPNGAYLQIVEQVGKALTIGVWSYLTRRTGLWDGACLRPSCYLGRHDEDPCKEKQPLIANRIPTVEIRLLPVIERELDEPQRTGQLARR